MSTADKVSTPLLRSAAERAAATLSQRASRMSGGIRYIKLSQLEPTLALAFELGSQWQARRK